MASTEYSNAVAAANANAGGFVLLAKGALGAAQGAIANVGYGAVTWAPPAPPGTPVTGQEPKTPTIVSPGLNLPGSPGDAPEPQEISSLELGVVPSNSITVPSLDFGNAPSSDVGDVPTPPTLDLNQLFPTPPAALSGALPGAPPEKDLTVPEKPELLIPAFVAGEPGSPDAPPTDGEQVMGRNYATMSLQMRTNVDSYVNAYIQEHSPNYFAQMGRIEAQLAKYLDGGTGLDPAVEDAIYSRARGKNDAEARRVRDQALNDAAARGFTMPTGALMSAAQQARQAGADNNARAAAEIVVMRAEMEQKNLQFAVTTTAALHDSMRSAAAAYMQTVASLNGQAMDYAKSVFSTMVEMYNASLRYYSTQVEVFKARASIFDSQLKAELAKLEVFRSEVSAFEATTQAERAKIDIYTARLGALSTLSGVFKAQVEAAVAKASLEKLKLEVFQSQVQAYGAQVQAKSSEWAGYTARIGGEEAKAKIYSAQMSGYQTQVEAYKSGIEAQVAQIDATAKSNQAVIGGYQGSVQAYTAHVGAESARSNAHNENNRMVITEFQREVAAFMAKANIELEKYKYNAQASLANATGGLTAQIESARAKSQYGATVAQLSNDGAQIYGQLAGSAMAGMNTLAALTESL